MRLNGAMKSNPMAVILFILAAIVAVVVAWFLVKVLGAVLQIVFTAIVAVVLLVIGYTWLRRRQAS